MKKIVFAVVSALVCVSCSVHYSSSGEEIYKKSRNGKGLIVPAPLTDLNVSHFYDLPDQNQNPNVSIVPPSLSLSEEHEKKG